MNYLRMLIAVAVIAVVSGRELQMGSQVVRQAMDQQRQMLAFQKALFDRPAR